MYDIRTGNALVPFNLPLPSGSIVDSVSGRKEDTTIFYKFSSFGNPGIIYKWYD